MVEEVFTPSGDGLNCNTTELTLSSIFHGLHLLGGWGRSGRGLLPLEPHVRLLIVFIRGVLLLTLLLTVLRVTAGGCGEGGSAGGREMEKEEEAGRRGKEGEG